MRQGVWLSFICVTIVWNVQKVSPRIQRLMLPKTYARCLNSFYYRTDITKEVALGIQYRCLTEYLWRSSGTRMYPGKSVFNEHKRAFTDRCVRKFLSKKPRRVKRQAVMDPSVTDSNLGDPTVTDPLPPLELPPKLTRKEIRMMLPEELDRFKNALTQLKFNLDGGNYSRYDILAEHHTGSSQYSAHGGCNFVGWHRAYLMMLQEILTEIDPLVVLPYWDSTLDSNMNFTGNDPRDSMLWHPDYFGNGDGFVTTGAFADWPTPIGRLRRNVGVAGKLFEDHEIEAVTNCTRMEQICGGSSPMETDLEFLHGAGHIYVDGNMGILEVAPHDPLFYLHHAFVDLIYELYRQNARSHGTDVETDYPADFGDSSHGPDQPMGEGMEGMQVLDGLSDFFTDILYEYAPRPTCEGVNLDCGTPLLRCIKNTRDKHVCASITEEEYEDYKNGGGGGGGGGHDLCTTPQPPPSTTTTSTTTSTTITTTTTTQAPTTTTTPKPRPTRPPPPRPKPKPHYGGLHRPIQNSFCANGKTDINQWVYIPVSVTIQRPPDFMKYGSYPVVNGEPVLKSDIYAPQSYTKIDSYLRPGRPKDYGNCKSTYSGAGEIYIETVGLNYDGKYTEFAIVDHRLAISVSVAYVAIKDPQDGNSDVLLSAYDSCGRVCRPSCLIPGTKLFRPCSGAVRLTAEKPRFYGSNFGESVLGIWDFENVTQCPQFRTNEIYVSFFCDYSNRWPWEEALNHPEAKVTPPRKKSSDLPNKRKVVPPFWKDRFPKQPKQPKQPTPTMPIKRNKCVLNKYCTALLNGDCKAPCEENASFACDGHCNRFAKCVGGRYYVQQCYRMHFDARSSTCVKGQGHCTEAEWRPWKKRGFGK